MSDDGSWTVEGAYEVAPGVQRIPLPLPTDGLRAVNVYAIEASDGITLVDGGWSLVEGFEQLQRSLQSFGYSTSDVVDVLVTHLHRDHYTQAVELRRIHGCKVALGSAERHGLERIIEARQQGDWAYGGTVRLIRAGALKTLRRMFEASGEHVPDPAYELPDEWLEHGARIVVGARQLTALHTPGHTAGHMVFLDAELGLLFTGDHVLPHITPSIGHEPVPTAAPLSDYLTSLAMLRAMPDAQLLPAHGPVADSVHTRIDELLLHHEERLGLTLRAVEHGAATAYEVATLLPWTRRGRNLAELDLQNASLAITETLAHLDVLASRGQLEVRQDSNLADRFYPVAAPPTTSVAPVIFAEDAR